MRVFLAGAFNHQDDIKIVRAALEEQGHVVTSTWLDEPPIPDVGKEWFHRGIAVVDRYDVERADTVAVFTFWPSLGGGYHTETGMALAWKKRLIIVGPPTFYGRLADETYETAQEFIDAMGDEAPTTQQVVSAWPIPAADYWQQFFEQEPAVEV